MINHDIIEKNHLYKYKLNRCNILPMKKFLECLKPLIDLR